MKYSNSVIATLVLTTGTTTVLSSAFDDNILNSKESLNRMIMKQRNQRQFEQVLFRKAGNNHDVTTTPNMNGHDNIIEPKTGGFISTRDDHNKNKQDLFVQQQVKEKSGTIINSPDEHEGDDNIKDRDNKVKKEMNVKQQQQQQQRTLVTTNLGTCYARSNCTALPSTSDKTIEDCYNKYTSGVVIDFYGLIINIPGLGFKSNTDNTCIPLGYCLSDNNCYGEYLPAQDTTSTINKCFSDSTSNGGLNGVSMKSTPPLPGDDNTDYCLSKQEAGFGGDPHFNIWGSNHKTFSYHGECDLVMIHTPSFHNDDGLDLHIRTTRLNSYSFIESAALKIGNDILQIDSTGEYKINGLAGTMFNTTTASFSDFDFAHWHSSNDFYHRFRIDFDNIGGKLDFKVFEGVIYVSVSGGIGYIFKGSHGMSGDADTGRMIGRDRKTIIDDPTNFALEWQVRHDIDGMLFDVARPPQWPATCLPPNKFVPRLGGSGSSSMTMNRKEAELLCSDFNSSDKDNCIFDVLATGNKEFSKLKQIDQEADFEIATLLKNENIIKELE